MRKVFGVLSILLGICCLLAAVGFVFGNRQEDRNAEHASKVLLQDIQEQVLQKSIPQQPAEPVETPENPTETPLKPEEDPQKDIEVTQSAGDSSVEIPSAKVNGYDCVGILSIPVLELELPVLDGWSYAKLKVAPCRYYGNCYGPDFVISAHNYKAHFKRLSELQPGDLVLFTDLSGQVRVYEVVLSETLPPNATREMITSGFDLTLYTCTPGGSNRLTVRCTSIQHKNRS